MDYIQEASLTKSDQFHGDLVSLPYLKALLNQAIIAINALDAVKKALFYGKEPGEQVRALRNEPVCSNIHLVFDADKSKAVDILHSIIGKATESGELLELLEKTLNGEKFDPTNFKEEIGDGMWYDAIGLKAVDSTIEAEQERNIAKLRARFPNRFTEYDANNRDLFTERGILEKE